MSGFGGQVLSHVVRRSVEQYPGIVEGDLPEVPPEIKLELTGTTIFMLLAIVFITSLIVASVDYTVGSVIAALTMIESPSTTTIIESAPPAYSDEPDAPLEKSEEKFDDKADESIDILVVEQKPVTARVFTAIKHLHAVGGYFSRWRGLFQSVLYHIGLNVLGHIIGGLFALALNPFFAQCLGYVFSAIATCRLRMLWTHSMIAMPTAIPWYKRFVPRKQCKALLLPAAVYGIARQMCILVPLTVAHIMRLDTLSAHYTPEQLHHLSEVEVAMIILRVLAVPVSALLVVLFVYLPAEAALTRVEACLLPADQQTIVPFDREAIVGEIDLTERGSSKKLFKSAWKSFNNTARIRLVKLYIKLAAYQFAVCLVALHLVFGVLYFTCREQIINTMKAVAA